MRGGATAMLGGHVDPSVLARTCHLEGLNHTSWDGAILHDLGISAHNSVSQQIWQESVHTDQKRMDKWGERLQQ